MIQSALSHLGMRGFALCLFTILLLAPGRTHAKMFGQFSSWDEAVHDSLDDPQPDTARCFVVREGSTWSTDLGEYRFESGIVTFFRTVMGRPTGCHFEGQGTIFYVPPSPIEQGQLYRYCKDSTLRTQFTELFIRFYDSATEADLRGCCDSISTDPKVRGSDLDSWQKRADDDLRLPLATAGWIVLQRDQAPHAYLLVTGKFKGQEPLYFQVNDDLDEAVTLLRRANLLAGRSELEMICSYDRRRPPDESANRRGWVHRGLKTVGYVTDVTIKPSVEMAMDASLSVIPARSPMRDIHLTMVPKLKIERVWINGDSAAFRYDDDASYLVAVAPVLLAVGDTSRVRIRYSGKELLYKFIWGDFFVNYTTQWLPVTDDNRRTQSDYETTFRFPKHYDLVSCGELLVDSVEGDWRIKRWKTYDPSAYVSFNYGSFDVLTSTIANGPVLHVYRSKNHLQGLFGSDMKKRVAADIEGSLQLFARLFGPYPWPQLSATEIPAFHGQGLPQLLHLAWFNFESDDPGITDHFRAHEVAHQWFGHLVGWTNYHDQWLSEGFAEYAGAMYVQAVNRDKNTFLDLVKQWRSDILDVGGHVAWHAGPYVAPIWLGFRCSSTSSPASYGNLIYSKGAYILHMLRNMMHDYRTGSDARFNAMMRDYVSSHAHAEATTEDFRSVVERHFGTDMGWFFDQWVYGVQIPRYEYSWDRKKTDDGRWIVSGQIDQFDVDSTFRVFMPVSMVFDGGRRTFLQEVKSSRTTFETPPLTDRPKDVVFNDYLTVLCREKTVRKP